MKMESLPNELFDYFNDIKLPLTFYNLNFLFNHSRKFYLILQSITKIIAQIVSLHFDIDQFSQTNWSLSTLTDLFSHFR